MKQTLRERLGWYLRGLAMGAADVVPGVSGGTIAFITGIYERLLAALASIDLGAWRALHRGGLAAAWRHIDATFLLLVLAGIVTSIVSLARLIGLALEHYPIPLWSFFFGLILGSTVHIARRIDAWHGVVLLSLVVGAAAAFVIGELRPSQLPATPPYFFLAGAVAICAMILPGVSGSFILLLLGMYSRVLEAVSTVNLAALGSFVAGCAVGLISFTHILNWLLHRYHRPVLALLTGFLLGSLNLVWPWKIAAETVVKANGEVVAVSQNNVLPSDFVAATGQDPYLLAACTSALLGLAVVWVLEIVARKS